MHALNALFGNGNFLPHGYCFTWTPGLLWSMVGADAVIAMSYFSIPLAILTFLRLRADLPMRWVAWLFCAFIFSCGLTHVMDIWTIWSPDYALQALTKTATAAISLVTAVALWPLIPKALAVPSTAQLRSATHALETEAHKRRGAEDRLDDVQQTLAATLEDIDAGYVATDAEGRITRINRVACAILGWSADDARGRGLLEVVRPEGAPAGGAEGEPWSRWVEVAGSNGQARQVALVTPAGRRTEVELKASLTRADDGAVRGSTLVLRDMTALLQAEASASRLAAIVESSHDAIIAKTLEGRITSWNAAAEALFGYTPEQAIGQHIAMLFPPERVGEEDRILAAIGRGERVPAFDTVRLARDGSPRLVSVAISPIRGPGRRIVGASKIVRDVAQERQAEQALRETELKAQRLEAQNREIEEANRLKSQFLANMSHELRTPLNAIIGFAELMAGGGVDPASPQHTEFLGHIATSGRHLLQLINDVLDLSKVEAGKFEFHPRPVDLAPLVQEVVATLEPALARKRLRMAVAIDPALGVLKIDPGRLKQVLYNYVSNAIKFTDPGGTVGIEARPEGEGQFRIEVRDSGIGIAAEDLPRLFVEFQQLQSGYDKRHQGTGLGLSLTRRLAEAQGGRVGVSSTPGEGSTFYVVLPRTPAYGAAPEVQVVDANPAPPRWLVVEDADAPAWRLAPALARAGYEVDVAPTSARALVQASRRAYDAIALDFALEDNRGLGALADIRREGASRRTPVLGVSVAAGGRDAAAFAIANILAKPLNADEVVAAMQGLRDRRGGRPRVMVVDDDPRALALMSATLAAIDIEALCYLTGRAALHDVQSCRPDAVILDLMMPELDGFAVLDLLRRMPGQERLPVLIWTSMLLTDEEYARLASTARAILGKGGGEVAAMLEALRRWRPASVARSEP